VPIAGKIFIGISERVGSLYPDLFTLEGPLQFLQHTKLVVMAVYLGLTVQLLEYLRCPAGRDHTVNRDLLLKISMLSSLLIYMPVNGFERFDNRLEAVFTAESNIVPSSMGNMRR
jgi:hypothetical protein